MNEHMLQIATSKQISYIKKLAFDKEYVVLDTINQLPKRMASQIINFLQNGDGEYLDFVKYIRKRGPKIQHLSGNYLYDDMGG